MIHVAHLITGLDRGGAETNLAQLVARMDRQRFRNTVITAIEGGPLADTITAAGVEVHCLGMRRGIPDPRGLMRLVRLLRQLRPDLLQTWLYHGDFLGLIAAPLAGNPPVIWNLRCSNMDLALYGPLTRWLVRLLARLSHLPAAVIANSESGRRQHAALGYNPGRWEFIPNGFDTERLRPDPDAGRRLRQQLGLPATAILVGHVARLDPMKDHPGFLAAAARIRGQQPDAHFILVGKGTEHLADLVARHGLTGQAHLLGERDDVTAMMPGFDLLCLSSAFGEGFPTVLGEAMACGVPCLSTDVGDAALVVGDCGSVVPPSDPAALARAALALLNEGRDHLAARGQASRKRILAQYALPETVGRYETLYGGLVQTGAQTKAAR